LIGAGLLARNAVERGLKVKPWVKTSLAPGSQVVAQYLEKSGLQKSLDKLGFNLVGFGCTTCIGNSGPLPAAVSKTINANDLVAASVLSGNRNFEGRVNPDVQANYLASPPLVVAFALAGTAAIDLTKEPLGRDKKGEPVFFCATSGPLTRKSRNSFARMSPAPCSGRPMRMCSTATRIGARSRCPPARPMAGTRVPHMCATRPISRDSPRKPKPVADIANARILALFGDKITTDHISPAGSIKAASPAGKWLQEQGVEPKDFNQYGTRRGNHEVMMRGTFANIRIKNFIAKDAAGNVPEGGVTRHFPGGEEMSIYDAAMKYASEDAPLVVFAGAEYGNGSSRDWAAKGTRYSACAR